jgi:hypothetical protein
MQFVLNFIRIIYDNKNKFIFLLIVWDGAQRNYINKYLFFKLLNDNFIYLVYNMK